jgi:hypothetical protein
MQKIAEELADDLNGRLRGFLYRGQFFGSARETDYVCRDAIALTLRHDLLGSILSRTRFLCGKALQSSLLIVFLVVHHVPFIESMPVF